MTNQNVNLQSKLLEKLNIFSKLSVKLVFLSLLTVLYLFVPISVAHAQNTSDDPAYPVCYFATSSGADRTWRWGLKSNTPEDWFQLRGHWQKNPDTNTWKFITTTPKSAVSESCKHAKAATNLDGYHRQKIYAAVSNEGKNYPIVYRD